jgi:hypothetical protein
MKEGIWLKLSSGLLRRVVWDGVKYLVFNEDGNYYARTAQAMWHRMDTCAFTEPPWNASHFTTKG